MLKFRKSNHAGVGGDECALGAADKVESLDRATAP